MSSIAEQYADYATSLQFDELPPAVVDHAKKLILDIMANDLGGHAWMESGPTILDGVRRLNGAGAGSTVLATGCGRSSSVSEHAAAWTRWASRRRRRSDEAD